MAANWRHLLDSFDRLQVMVIGEAMLDRYLNGTTDRFCQEAPVPIVSVRATENAPGGAANTAANLAALGARVTLLSVTGEDEEGTQVLACLRERGVITDGVVIEPGRKTLAKQRLVAGAQLLMRFDSGSTDAPAPDAEAALIDALKAGYAACDAVVVSDYGYGILTPSVIAALENLQSSQPRPIFCDAKDLPSYRRLHPAVVKPNYAEAMRLLGQPAVTGCLRRAQQIGEAGDRLLDLTGAEMVAVTLDVDGALMVERGREPRLVAARAHVHARAAGAGDSFLAAMALCIASGADSRAATEMAVSAAAVGVRREGTAVCSAAELRAYLESQTSEVVAGGGTIEAIAEDARRAGRRIVFTNGCFDIVHSGHTRFLAQAKSLGDLLIVGLNTDESVARLKGPGRPVNGVADRAQVLAALSCVDYVVPFAEDGPDELIRVIRPDVFVKGGDYDRDSLPEASLVEALGGVVRILDYVDAHSTTAIIERIRDHSEPGATMVISKPEASLP